MSKVHLASHELRNIENITFCKKCDDKAVIKTKMLSRHNTRSNSRCPRNYLTEFMTDPFFTNHGYRCPVLSSRWSETDIWAPKCDVRSTDTTYTYEFHLPGLDLDNVKVMVDNDVLTVSGHRETTTNEKRDGYHHRETSSGSFTRSFRLATDAVPTEREASYTKGVLSVTFQRTPQPEDNSTHIPVVDLDANQTA